MKNKALISEHQTRLAQADALLKEKQKHIEAIDPVLAEKENALKVIEDKIAEKSVQLEEAEEPTEKMVSVLFDDGSAGIFSEAELESVETIPKEQFDTLTSILSGDSKDDVDDTDDLSGIYLVSPHPELIAAGKKSLIVKSRDFSNQCGKELILCSSGLCFGTLKMKLPREASRKDLDELYPAHRITPEEIKDWWPDTKVFYLYDVYDVSIWDKPRHANIPQGVQTFIKKVELTDGKLKQDATDPYLTYPDQDKKYKGMVHSHIRGRSVHLDMRLQISKDHMLGWTLYIPKGLSRDLETFAEAKALNEKEIMPIVRETMSDSTKSFNCGPKEAQPPIEWATYEGTVQPGEVGATKYEHGHFIIIDSFDVQFGASKSYFHEYFCDGKIFKGRLVFRLLENKEEWEKTDQGEELTWMMNVALKSPTPYVISTRAVKKAWVPPFEASALPRNIRNKVPEKFRYWKEKDEKKRLKIRDGLVEEIKKKLLKLGGQS